MEAVQRALRTLDFQELQRSNSQKVQCKDVASPRPAPSLVSRLAALYFVLSYGLAMYCWILSLIGSVLFPKVVLPILIAWKLWTLTSNATHDASWPTPMKHWGMWKAFTSYFPHCQIHKTTDLPNDRPYMFCYHPHGVLTVGGWLAFGTDALGWSRIFPGIDVRILTLNVNFKAFPLREYLLLHGVCSVDKSAILQILSRGKSVFLAVGGGSESLLASPGRYDIILRRRRGFIKLALRTGTSLVPCIGFGEPDTFNTLNELPPMSPLRKFQRQLTRVFGFTLPIAFGRGVFGGVGLLPNPAPLDIVIGAPIDAETWTDVPEGAEFDAAVDKLHHRYMQATIQLYQDHQEKFAKGAEDLRVVE